MIDDTLQDQATLYALGSLQGEEAAAFEKTLVGNAELQALVDEIIEAAASLTHALPSTKAPPEVLPRLLAEIRAERAPVAQPLAPETSTDATWMPWALAASIAIAATVGFLSGSKVNAVRSGETIAKLRSRADVAEAEQKRLSSTIATLTDERVALENRVNDLRRRDAISQVEIATLKTQAGALAKAYAGVTAYVVWDATAQAGVMRFDRLPPAGAGKDYQMWVIENGREPVSAGIFSAGSGGELNVNFKPSQPIALAKNFAISVEQKGGSARPKGDIVLMSN